MAAEEKKDRPFSLTALLLAIVGGVLVIRALINGPTPPPQPPASAARALPAAESAVPLRPSEPRRIDIPDVKIHAGIGTVGQNPDGTIQVPTEADARRAGWYDLGPTPGEAGPAVLVGHVDSRLVPPKTAAFYYLGETRPGDLIRITRADGSVAVFRTDSVETARKADFPSEKVYGSTSYAALRLITCGGGWTPKGGYDSNVIVYAHLVGSEK